MNLGTLYDRIRAAQDALPDDDASGTANDILQSLVDDIFERWDDQYEAENLVCSLANVDMEVPPCPMNN